MALVGHESSLSPPPDDDIPQSDHEEDESGQSAIAEKLDRRVTTGHKPSTSEHIRFPDVTLPSAKSIGKRKEHIEMVLYPLPPGKETANDSTIIGSHCHCISYQEAERPSSSYSCL
jgi:hypothetical protein